MFFFKSSTLANYEKIFYDFNIESISGEMINFNKYKGKAVLVVNTASYCGFTKQYDELQSLWDNYKSRGLIVLGIPWVAHLTCPIPTFPSKLILETFFSKLSTLPSHLTSLIKPSFNVAIPAES